MLVIRGFVGCVLLVVVAGCATDGGGGSSRDAGEVAGDLARLAIETGGLERILDSGAELAWEVGVDTLTLDIGREPTDAEQAAGKAAIRDALAESMTAEAVTAAGTEVYTAHFSAAELEQILAFYDSPVGRKSLELEGTIRDEVDTRLDRVLGGENLEALIERIDTALAVVFPDLADGDES